MTNSKTMMCAAVVLLAVVATVVHGQTDFCTFCSDGSSTIPEEKLDVVTTALLGGMPATCATIGENVGRAAAGSDECNAIQRITGSFCGCPITQQAPEGKCTLCSDGSSVPPEKLDMVATQSEQGIDLPCSALVLSAFQLDLGTDECFASQAFGVNSCGCPPLTPPADACSLCIDGSPINPANADRDIGGDLTCGLIASFLPTQVEANSEECHAFQATAGLFCGCAYDAAVLDEEFGICRVCGQPGTTLPDPTRIVKLPGFGSRTLCANFEAELALDVAPFDGCDGEFRDAVAAACCKCADSNSGPSVQLFQKNPNGRQGCAWLAEQDSDTIALHCSKLRKVSFSCPGACGVPCEPGNGNDRDCDDSPEITFPTFTALKKSCQWLSRKNPAKKRKICKFSPEARMSCPLTCDTCP